MTDSGIYIHIPFCVRKCGYCDFLSFGRDKCTEAIYEAYIDALIAEIEYKASTLKSDKLNIKTVYIGGGTPSILEVKHIKRILKALDEAFSIAGAKEITIECNPGTTDYEKLKSYLDAGINRLSLGLQTTDDTLLKRIGRIHTYSEFLEQYENARKAGFENINVDLISALPGESVETYIRDLDRIIKLNPEHISSYSLILEEGTSFFENDDIREMLPDEDTEVLMYNLTRQRLKAAGYEQYEISNYAKPGYESRHNSSYWTGLAYLGLGLGASSYFNHYRYSNTDDLKKYMGYRECYKNNYESYMIDAVANAPAIYDKCNLEYIDESERMKEYMILGLRRTEGVSISEFKRRFDRDIIEVYGEIIDRLLVEGNLVAEDDIIRIPDEKLIISNSIMVEFM